MESIRFIPAHASHIPALFNLLNNVYRIEVGDSGVGFKKHGEERYSSGEEIQELLSQGEMIVAEDSSNPENLVGCIFYRFYDEEDTDGITKKHLYFGPLASIQKGVGKSLIQLVEQKAKEENCHYVDIRVVNVRTDVLPMYEKNGYVQYGEAPFPAPEVCVRNVHFCLLRKSLV